MSTSYGQIEALTFEKARYKTVVVHDVGAERRGDQHSNIELVMANATALFWESANMLSLKHAMLKAIAKVD